MNRFRLWLELIAVFFAVPAVYAAGWLPVHELWVLAAVFVWAFWLLRQDRGFDRTQLWGFIRFRGLGWPWARTAFVLVSLLLLTALFWPQWLFVLPLERPWVWLLVLVFYPVLSVYPQELIYRAFFFHRYHVLLPRRWLFGLNVAAFSFLHIVFLNPVALALTLIGGYFFARTYLQTRSLAAVSAEHALYGGWIFTVGLGSYFYRGL